MTSSRNTARAIQHLSSDNINEPSESQPTRLKEPTVTKKATGLYWMCGCPQNEGETVCPKNCQCTETREDCPAKSIILGRNNI